MIKPTGYRILLKQLRQEQLSTGGIVMHSDADHQRQQNGYNICEVVEMGDACYHSRAGESFPEGAWCKAGDKVYIANYGGKMISPEELLYFAKDSEVQELEEMKKNGLSFHIVNDEDIMGVIND